MLAAEDLEPCTARSLSFLSLFDDARGNVYDRLSAVAVAALAVRAHWGGCTKNYKKPLAKLKMGSAARVHVPPAVTAQAYPEYGGCGIYEDPLLNQGQTASRCTCTGLKKTCSRPIRIPLRIRFSSTVQIEPRLLVSAIESSSEGITITDARHPDMPLVYVNRGFEVVTGYRREEVLGRNCRFLQGDDVEQPQLDVLRNGMREARSVSVQVRNYTRDGRLFWNQLSIAPILDEQGQLTHYVGIQKDITDSVVIQLSLRERERELIAINRKLENLAIHDGLTKLLGRHHFLDVLTDRWMDNRSQVPTVCLFMIDVDCFKQYNDTYGHVAGDAALAQVGMALRKVFCRDSDLIARYGGEEFVAATTSNSNEDASALAANVCHAIHKLQLPHSTSTVADVLTVSVGVVAVDPRQCSIDAGLKAADVALYEAKQQGRNQHRIVPMSVVDSTQGLTAAANDLAVGRV